MGGKDLGHRTLINLGFFGQASEEVAHGIGVVTRFVEVFDAEVVRFVFVDAGVLELLLDA